MPGLASPRAALQNVSERATEQVPRMETQHPEALATGWHQPPSMGFLRRVSTVTAFATATAVLVGARDRQLFWNTAEPFELKLQAPLAKLFAQGRTDEHAKVAGVVSYRGPDGRPVTIDAVQVSVRGNTSRRDTECTFPKLKLDLDGAGTANSPFAGFKAIKIGTHCGEAAAGELTPRFGRLANQTSPLREAFVYRLLGIAGVPTLNARPARITYIDPDAPSGQPLVRDAVLLEDDDDAVARFGAKGEIDEQAFGSARDRFAAADTARLAFAEAMVGNFDWCLKFTPDDTFRCDARHPLWNITALDMGGGRAVPLVRDFDLAGMVTGRHAWFDDVFSAAFSRSGSPIDVEVIAQVQRTRSLFPRAVLEAARREFLGRRAAASHELDRARLDPGGLRIIRQYLDAFYSAIGTEAAFYRPVLIKDGTRLYLDAAKTKEACEPGDTIPVGTAIGEPAQRSGSMIQAVLLDVMWRWGPPNHCDAIHSGPVWIDAAAVGTDYPAR
jgi:hypothetical protein